MNYIFKSVILRVYEETPFFVFVVTCLNKNKCVFNKELFNVLFCIKIFFLNQCLRKYLKNGIGVENYPTNVVT